MFFFEIVVALLLAGAALTLLSRRLGTPYPALVALAGAGLALVPGVPTVVPDPELALTLFVAPVLLDSAFDASPPAICGPIGAPWPGSRSARSRLRWSSWRWSLGSWCRRCHGAVAVALGAMVAPPDAAAATAVLRQLRPPHRLLVILEGESLFNDASALLIFRLATGRRSRGRSRRRPRCRRCCSSRWVAACWA